MIKVQSLLVIVAVSVFAEIITDAFPIGTERSYALTNDVSINYKKGDTNVGYRVTGILKVGAVWGTDEEKLLRFQLITPKLQIKSESSSSYVDKLSSLDAVLNTDFYAIWNLGKITKTFFNKKEDPSVINLKKALIGLFQYQLMDGRYVEDDVSGKCDVIYRSKSSNHYEKMKTNCKNDDLEYHSRDDTVIGVIVVSWRMSDFVITPDGTLDKVDSTEYHEISVNTYKNAGAGLESVLKLKFDGSISNVPTINEATIGSKLKSIKGIKSQPLKTYLNLKGAPKTLTVKQLVKSFKDDLSNENVGKERSALALTKIVPVARKSTKDEFLQILNSHTMKDCRGQLLDLMAATQSRESHEAVKTIIDFTSADQTDDAERYLQSLGIGTRPKDVLIIDLLQLAEKKFSEPKVKDTLIQTISSMGYRYARLRKESYESSVVQKVEGYLLKSLDACKKPLCKVKYIRGLQNLQSPRSKTVLWNNVYDDERQVTVTAMKALRSYPQSFWLEEDKKQFLKIFYQRTRKFDSSVRTLALDVILELRPSVTEVKELLHFLGSNDKAFEVKQYLLQNLAMKSDLCLEFRKKFKDALSDEPLLNNYHIIGQRGISAALSRTFSKAPSFNGTLLSIQEVHGGILKRGFFYMTLETNNERFSVFTLGLYAAGLSSLVGGSDNDDNNSDESATAGMEIKVQGSNFRPLQFFHGQGELMGHVWSGTASNATPAYTATTLLHDHEEILKLQNGAALNINILGAMSIDLNGQIQFSLWNRNAHCQVDKNTGIALTGNVSLDTSFISLSVAFTITKEPKFHLISDTDFSSDVKVCLQLSQPDTVLRHNIIKTENIPGHKYNIRRTMNHKYRLPGFTHFLNQKNNDMCESILSYIVTLFCINCKINSVKVVN